MEEVRTKYNNFTAFLKDHIKDNSYLTMLSNVSVERFLEKIKENKHKSPEEITKELCQKCNIDINNFSPYVVNKFQRYIEYFQKISEHI